MFRSEYEDLIVGDVVYWNGGLYQVDNINGRWGVHGENGWVEINPKESDGFVYVGKVFVPENLNGHCWHYSGTCLSSRPSLMAIYTPDYTCCHCGIRCVAQRKLEPQPEGHGEYYPARNRKYLPGHIFDGNRKPCHKDNTRTMAHFNADNKMHAGAIEDCLKCINDPKVVKDQGW